VLLAVGGLVLGALLFGLLRHHVTVDCRAGEATCTVADHGLGRDGGGRFERRALRGARVLQEFTYGKGKSKTEWGVPVLLLEGRELRLLRVTPRAAREAAERVRAFVASGEPTLHLELREPFWLLLFPLAFTLAGVALLLSGLRGAGRVRLVLDRAREAITARRSCFGVPLGSRALSSHRVVDVVVEPHTLPDLFRGRGGALDPGGRLLLVYEDGTREPLTSRPLRGERIHHAAAEALRQALGLEPRPLPELPPPPRGMWSTAGGKLGVVWLGACCGSLLGIAAFAGVGLALGQLKLRDSAGGFWYWGGLTFGVAGGIAIAVWLARPRRR